VLEILYEDNHIIAVNKHSSDIVQPDPTGDKSLEEYIKEYIKNKYDKKGEAFLGVVHRIDRPVSGVVIFARTSKALARLSQMFLKKEIKKTYWAIVKNRPNPESGTIENYLVRNTKLNKSFVHGKPVPDSKKAILHYKLVAQSDNYNLLEIQLETGLHHQIRCQLSNIGCPIKGDLKYGFPRSNSDNGISLLSRSIEFIHPVKKEKIKIVAPVPNDTLWHEFEKQMQ